MLAFGAVAPLLSFSRSTTLDLNWFFTSTIDDDALKIVAQSCGFSLRSSALESQLRSMFHFQGICPPCTTLPPLARDRNALLRIPDGHRMRAILYNHPQRRSPRLQLGSLQSPIQSLACQLHTLLPKLTYVDARQYLGFPLPHQFQYIRGEWKRVADSLELLVAGAQTRTKHAELIASLKDSGRG